MQTPIFSFEAIGTKWSIDIYEEINQRNQAQLLKHIISRIDTFDKTYSRFRSDSLVTQISHKKGTYEFPDDAEELFSIYQKLYDLTGHTVTPLIGDVLIRAGYDASYSLIPKQLQQALSWEDTLAYSHPILTVKQPTMLDFGAAGKGYIIDIISQLLKHEGITTFCVEAGGDLLHQGTSPLRVGLEHPDDPTQAIGIATIHNESICGSAGNRRTWGQYHHILNPHTLTSPTHIKAVWTVANNARIADAMSTCLFFVEPEKLADDFFFDYIILYEDYTFRKSQDFPGELFIA